MEYFLVTTADEATWDNRRKTLFLGEWCKLHKRKQVWELVDSETACPLLQTQIEREDVLKFIEKEVQIFFPELVAILNEIHNVKFSERYWEIVLGHWFYRCIQVLYNRYFLIYKTFNKFSITSTKFYPDSCWEIAHNSLSFILQCDDDIWNNLLFKKIINFNQYPLIFEEIDFISRNINETIPSKNSFKRSIFNGMAKILALFIQSTDVFIYNTYFSFWNQLKLQISFLQFPQFWEFPELSFKAEVDINLRKKIKFKTDKRTPFQLFICEIIPQVIPLCYIENYPYIRQQVLSARLPNDPQFIFTSNNFDTDEGFKIWTAEKVENGSKYFTGQHGNNYGTHFYAGGRTWPERKAADAFFSWGWSDSSKNVVPAFNFKLGNKKGKFDTRGGLLLIEVCYPRWLAPWDDYFRYNEYQAEQFKFVESLTEEVSAKLTVRLHSEFKTKKWDDLDRWRERSPSTNIELGNIKISDLIAKNRLVIHSYDSTGILETLALNIPTMCFWQFGLDHVLPEARPYYELLIEVGILHFSAESIAFAVNKNWDNIEQWWYSSKVQFARTKFCENYSRIEIFPVLKMHKLLMAQMAKK